MNTKIKFFILAATLGLFSCEKEIVFKGDVSAPRLVINGIVELDSSFQIHLERTTFFLDNSPPSNAAISSGATVIVKNLTTNDTYTMSQSTEGSLYKFPFLVTPNTLYSIEVNHPDFPAISAEMKTLSGIQILGLDTSSVMQSDESILRYDLTFNDNPNEENYYLVHVISSQVWDTEEYFYPMFIGSKDPAVDNSQNTDIDGSASYKSYILLSDATFNGSQKTLRFESSNPYYWGGTETSMTVELFSITKEVFLYRKSVSLFQEQDFFSEPVKVFSNILNGFGIFGFTSKDARTF